MQEYIIMTYNNAGDTTTCHRYLTLQRVNQVSSVNAPLGICEVRVYGSGKYLKLNIYHRHTCKVINYIQWLIENLQ